MAGEATKEIAECGSCPFLSRDRGQWLCDAGHDFGSGSAWDGYPRALAAIWQAPPEWCRLRQESITIRLAIPKET
jgi:hypothetical protein